MNTMFLTMMIITNLLYVVSTGKICVNIKGKIEPVLDDKGEICNYKLTTTFLTPTHTGESGDNYISIVLENETPKIPENQIKDALEKQMFEDDKTKFTQSSETIDEFEEPPPLFYMTNKQTQEAYKSLYKVIDLRGLASGKEPNSDNFNFKVEIIIQKEEMGNICKAFVKSFTLSKINKDSEDALNLESGHICCYNLYRVKTGSGMVIQTDFEKLLNNGNLDEVPLNDYKNIGFILEKQRTGVSQGVHFRFSDKFSIPDHIVI